MAILESTPQHHTTYTQYFHPNLPWNSCYDSLYGRVLPQIWANWPND